MNDLTNYPAEVYAALRRIDEGAGEEWTKRFVESTKNPNLPPPDEARDDSEAELAWAASRRDEEEWIGHCVTEGLARRSEKWGVELTARGRLALKVKKPEPKSPPKKSVTGKNVNARMLAKMQADTKNKTNECFGWTCKEWAKFLKCSAAAVVRTETWEILASFRAKLAAERAKDRRGRYVGRKRGEYGQDR